MVPIYDVFSWEPPQKGKLGVGKKVGKVRVIPGKPGVDFRPEDDIPLDVLQMMKREIPVAIEQGRDIGGVGCLGKVWVFREDKKAGTQQEKRLPIRAELVE